MTLTQTMRSGETRNSAVSFSKVLDDGELLTGTPTVTSVAGITLSNASVNTEELEIRKTTVPIGKAVQFSATSSTPAAYTVTIEVDTDATPAQTIIETVTLTVE